MRSSVLLVTSALIFCSPVYAQEKVTKEQLVGTWTMVSYKNVSGGAKTDIFGPQPKGMLNDRCGRPLRIRVRGPSSSCMEDR
jgi:hypothetical protein